MEDFADQDSELASVLGGSSQESDFYDWEEGDAQNDAESEEEILQILRRGREGGAQNTKEEKVSQVGTSESNKQGEPQTRYFIARVRSVKQLSASKEKSSWIMSTVYEEKMSRLIRVSPYLNHCSRSSLMMFSVL